MPRDYDITGPNAQHAIEAGLVTPAWYRTDIERPVMKALMKRSDQPALRDTILLLLNHGDCGPWGHRAYAIVVVFAIMADLWGHVWISNGQPLA
jgi:hypothetical protein